MIEITLRYQVNFAKMINKLYIPRQNYHGEKRESTNYKYKEWKVSNNTDATVLIKYTPSGVHLKLLQH